ncbi:hypothetical protein QIT50_gp15 [Pyrobaculum spherical virus 2]|uniref:Uncharacterized protein n=1 Tax=Pyrobaculum spherical virus 2 TaxID=2730632 RepID=A0A6M3VXT7_9VIRU|nr:hypothetical protein QIT50_gp15 [Pyrobaculum spherical virus 2]QJF12427.1 hypothetical protein PSV2_gp15 [Pyrobaculum spherical virus 2]
MLTRLFLYTTHAIALVSALIVLAIFGISLSSLVAAALVYAYVYGLIQFWTRHELPPPLLVFLYIIAFFGLIGETQFIVAASVIVAAFMLKELKIVKGNPLDAAVSGLKLAVLGGLLRIGLLTVAPIYEALKVLRRSPILAITMLLSFLLTIFALLSSLLHIEYTVLSTGPLSGVYGFLDPGNPFLWAGVIAYEELIGRPIPIADAFFVLLHYPSRAVYAFDKITKDPLLATAFALFVLTVIHIGTRWLWDLYKKYGFIGSLSGHAVYNAVLSANWTTFLLLFVLGIAAYIYEKTLKSEAI